jgi:hypothetical protein
MTALEVMMAPVSDECAHGTISEHVSNKSHEYSLWNRPSGIMVCLATWLMLIKVIFNIQIT